MKLLPKGARLEWTKHATDPMPIIIYPACYGNPFDGLPDIAPADERLTRLAHLPRHRCNAPTVDIRRVARR